MFYCLVPAAEPGLKIRFTVMQKIIHAYNAVLVSDLPVFMHNPLFEFICIFLSSEFFVSAIKINHCAEGLA